MSDSTPMIRTTINGKWELLLPKHRACRPEWATGWEPERLDAMRAVIGAGDIVFDVGAEEGDMSALYAQWGADTVLFEPNPLVWPNIRAIWESNGLKKPLAHYVGFAGPSTVHHEAFDAENADVDGWPRCSYGPMIAEHGFQHLAESAHVISSTRIDDVGIIPTVITIDVEGSEWEVLKGAEQTLRDHKPIVFVSVHPEMMYFNHNQGEAELHYWLKGLGYLPKHLAYDHEHHYMFLATS